jgi:hypothetical protein
MPNRDLKVSIDGDDAGLDAALAKSTAEARVLDRELAKLERQQAAEEKVAAASALAVREYAKAEDKAALSARKMGLEVARAAEQAERAQVRAAAAAEAAAKGSFDKERADKLAARADEAVERAAIKAAEAQLFQAEAARKAADAERKNAEDAKKAAREAELAAAKEHLGWLKSNGMAREHNRLLKDVKARFGELGSAGGAAFNEMETTGSKAFAALGNTSVGTALMVGAVISAIPFAALGAEVAIAGGIGGALAGLGLMATKSDADVQAALGKMTSHVKSETKQLAAPFKQTWLAIAQEGTKTFDALAPEIGRDFAKIAPVVTNFVHSAGYAATLLGPSLGHATDAADKLIEALGGKLPEISRSLGHAIDIVSKSAGENADEFANVTSAIAGMLPVAAHLLDWAVKAGPYLSPVFGIMAKGGMSVDALHTGLSKLTFGLVKTDHSLKIGGGSFETFAQGATVAGAKAGQLMTAEQAAALSADQLKAALDALTGKTLSEREALVGYRQAITAMNQALKDNGHAHGFATQKGAENEAALDKLAISAQAAAEAMKASGKDPAPFLEQARQRIVSMAEKMHYSASAANDLANKLLGIKPPPPIKLSMNDADFMVKLHKAQGLKLDPKTGLLKGNNSDYFNKWLTAKGLKIDPKTGKFRGDNADYYNKWLAANHLKINTKTGKITGNTAPFWSAVHSLPSSVGTRHIDIYAQMHLSAVQAYVNKRSNFNVKAKGGIVHRAAGGPVQRLAGGGPSGLVVGPGTGTSDSILTAVSNGEYVVRADRTAEFRPLLDLINYGRGRSPVAVASTLSGASGGSRPSQISQTNYFQAQDPHVVARESAREMAWMLRG